MRPIIVAFVALLIAAGTGAGARADQTDKRLGGLFAALKETKDPVAGRVATERIWEIWLETDDEEAERLLVQGARAMASEAFDDALDVFNRLVTLAPSFAEGWNRRATLLYLMGDYDGSVRDIEHTLLLEPRHFGALSGLGLVYLKLGNDEAALEAFKRALAINPFLPDVAENVATLQRRIKGKDI